MGEAAQREALDMSSLLAACSVMVTPKEMMITMAAIAIMGDFAAQPGKGEGVDQLRYYWRVMARALRAEVVPIAWNRIRCLTEAMATDPAVCKAMGGEETAEGMSYDPQSDLICRVAATMPVMPNKEKPSGERSATASVWCPHEVIISLAHGPT